MQGLFEVADNFTPSQRNRDAVMTSQCIYSFFYMYFVLMLAPKQLFNSRISK